MRTHTTGPLCPTASAADKDALFKAAFAPGESQARPQTSSRQTSASRATLEGAEAWRQQDFTDVVLEANHFEN